MEEVDKLNEYLDMGVEMAIGYAPGLALAVATLFIGLWVISMFCRGVRAGFEKAGMEPSLRSFLMSLISIGLKVLLLISVASMNSAIYLPHLSSQYLRILLSNSNPHAKDETFSFNAEISAPVNSPTFFPSLKNWNVGMALIPHICAISLCASTSTFTKIALENSLDMASK